MNEKIYEQAELILNEILSTYTKMADLYEEKKEALIVMNHEALKLADNVILDTNDLLKELNNERLRIVRQLGVEDMNISELIESAKKDNNYLVSQFEELKVKFSEVSKRIALLEKTNVELIQHGLIMSNKVMDIILQACTPQSTGYDCHGKNSQSSGLGISSVCEDA